MPVPRFLDPSVHEELGIMSEEVRAKKMAEEAAQEGGNSSNGHTNGHSNGEATKESASKAPTAALTGGTAKMAGLDLGPACSQCSEMMQRTGSCYTCSSCGNNTGCG